MSLFKCNNVTKVNLFDVYKIPPFSVLDTKQGYWQDRKRMWLNIIGDITETRNEDGKGNTYRTHTIKGAEDIAITSGFDPVFAELMYFWFCKKGGTILDPFAGEQTKGSVAGLLGYKYCGVEFRQEQVDVNNRIIKKLKLKDISYICGDSNNIGKLIKKKDFDMCFTSPPYYDLEVYSKEDMSALGSYDEFMEQYRNIFAQCYEMLSDDSFLVLKVGEIRDKKTGVFRCFVSDNIRIMTDIGFKFYNDAVLLNNITTGALRANGNMRTRKLVKTHQNVLIFYKGNVKNIVNVYPNMKNIFM